MALAHVWIWYCDLVGTTGEAPIGYPDIDAWQRLRGERVSVWDVELIIKLDALGRRLTWEAYNRRRK